MEALENPNTAQTLAGSEDLDGGVGGVLVENQAVGDLNGEEKEGVKGDVEADAEDGLKANEEIGLKEEGGGSGDPPGEGKEVEKEDGTKDEDTKDSSFSVGELVWAKTLNRPWWPGQIYDPLDASKDIAIYNRKDRVLVVFFGDETSAWCYPSLVKPFKENFVEMSVQGSSRSFSDAVEEAIRAVGSYVESQMTCFCAPPEVRAKLARPLASGAGIREGVVVPECRIDGLSVAEFEPAKFVSRLKCVSEIVSEISTLERTVFQSQLLAYNRANGWRQTDVYLSLLVGSDGCVTDALDFDDPTGKPLATPHEVVRPSTPGSNVIVSNSSAKKRGSKNERFTSDSPKKRKGKKFTEGINDDSAFSGSNDTPLQNDDPEAKGIKTAFLSRERKKSKYLSPPYTNLSLGCKSLASLKDSVPNSPRTPKVSDGEKSMGKAAGLTKCSGGRGRKKQINGEKIDANEVLSEFYSAALDPMYLEESKKHDYIKGFFVNLRCYRYLPVHQIDTELGSLRKALRKTDHSTNEEGAEARGAKEGALSGSPQKKCADFVFGFPGEDMDQSLQSTALGGTKRNAKQMEKEGKKGRQGAVSNSPQEGFVDIAVNLSESPLRKDACHKTNEETPDKGEGKEGTMSNGHKENYVDIPINSGTVMLEVNRPTALVGLEMNAKDTNENPVGLPEQNLEKRKGRDWKEAARSQNRQRTSADIPVVSPGEGVHESNCPTSEVGTEKNGQNGSEDSMFQISQGNLIDVAVGSAGVYMPRTDCATPESGPGKRIRKKKIATPGGIQIRSEKASSLTKKKTRPDKGENSAALLLNFGENSPLPAKDDLIKLFGRFGTLNEVETQVMEDTRSAQVVYLKRSDAEEAFTSSRKVSPFEPAVVNYRLEGYTTNSSASKPMVNSLQCIPNPVGANALPVGANALAPVSALPPNAEAPPLSYVRQHVQHMTSMLEKEGDNVPPEVKAELESQIKNLMKKLETVP